MSMELMVKAFKTNVGNPLRKLVLIKLADNANDKGECWPSYQHVADQCEISRTTVKTHVRALEEMGMLTREFRRKGELNQSNIFRINLDNPIPVARGGAGDALGREMPEVGQELPEGGAGAALGGRAGADPRISHSLEPVNEPVIESKSIGTSAKAAEPSRTGKQEYSPEFETTWQSYPKRAGSNSKQAAWKAWQARIREGITTADMQAGVERYAAFIAATGKAGTEYVKQASTFFGPNRHFEETWTAPPATQNRNNKPANNHGGFADRDYGATSNPSWARGQQ